jgi:hypothetical protein
MGFGHLFSFTSLGFHGLLTGMAPSRRRNLNEVVVAVEAFQLRDEFAVETEFVPVQDEDLGRGFMAQTGKAWCQQFCWELLFAPRHRGTERSNKPHKKGLNLRCCQLRQNHVIRQYPLMETSEHLG